MKDNSTLSTSCLIVNTISFDRLFMCKLIRTNDSGSILKKTEKNKIRKFILTLFHFFSFINLHRI